MKGGRSRPEPEPDELVRFNRQWADIVGSDPFYTSNLSQNSAHFALTADPPSLSESYGL